MPYFIEIDTNNAVLNCVESTIIPSPRHFEITEHNFNVYKNNNFEEKKRSGEIIGIFWVNQGSPEESRFAIQIPPV